MHQNFGQKTTLCVFGFFLVFLIKLCINVLFQDRNQLWLLQSAEDGQSVGVGVVLCVSVWGMGVSGEFKCKARRGQLEVPESRVPLSPRSPGF